MKVVVQPHDPLWADRFTRESGRVTAALGEIVVAVHHIGSTAVPTVRAKPIIDMLVEVREIAAVDAQNHFMESLRYEAMGEFGIAGRRYFRKNDAAGVRTHHVHVFAANTPETERHLAFRDFLIAHPERAKRYSDLKRGLAKQHADDREGYMDGKETFITEVVKEALAWRRSGPEAPEPGRGGEGP